VNNKLGINTTSPGYDLDVQGKGYINNEFYVNNKLGINTTSPGYDLDVQGKGYINNEFYVNNKLGIKTTSPGYDLDVQGNGYINNEFYVNNKLGINTTSPGYDLDVHGHTHVGSNLYVIDKIGIGTTNPSQNLDVQGDMYVLDDATFNSQILMKDGSTSSPGIAFNQDSNTGIMRDTDQMSIVFNASKIIDVKSNQVKVNTDFKADGDIRATGDVIAESDARVKKNIKPLTNAFEKIKQLQGCSFTRLRDDKECIGFIAQEVLPILPEVVNTDTDSKLYAIDYGVINALLVEGMKTMMSKMEKMDATIVELLAKK